MLILPQNSDLSRRFVAVRDAIGTAARNAGRSVDSVTLLAVSKGHGSEVVHRAAQLGQRHFGENYVTEALAKMAPLVSLDLTWHFIGRLQANKTREIAGHFQWVHGVDRLKIAQRLSEQRDPSSPPLNVCVQVNIEAEPSKAGVAPGEVDALLHDMALLPRLKLRGLMCMLPFELTDPVQQRAAFGRMRGLLDSPVARALGLDTLSMGMSADFEPAIAAGASIVRIGTALFGTRVRTVE
ncbi:MAG: YggS family pyridoxal phosphate-dependent enzyme [Steroidobacteraceae bacterium]